MVRCIQQTMLDDVLIMGPTSKHAFYFQIIPIYLSIFGKDSQLPAQGTTYRFSIHKGHHKFDQNRHPILANFVTKADVTKMQVSACKLNFYVPHYIKMRNNDFTLMLTQRQRNQNFEVGQYRIDAGHFIEEFIHNKIRRFKLKTFFSGDYELDFELYVERTRADLQKLVKNCQESFDKEIKEEKKDNNLIDILDGGQDMLKKRSKTMDKVTIKQNLIRRDSSYEALQGKKTNKNQKQKQYTKAFSQQYKSKDKLQVIEQKQQKEETQSNLFKMFGDKNSQLSQQQGKEDSSIVKVPLIHTKFKQLAKADTPYEIKMSQSSRLSQMETGEDSSIMDEPFNRNKALLMWLYVLCCLVVMYFAMHPKRSL